MKICIYRKILLVQRTTIYFVAKFYRKKLIDLKDEKNNNHPEIFVKLEENIHIFHVQR